MNLDMVIRGAVVVGAGAPRQLDVGVADGLIAALEPELGGPAGRLLLPTTKTESP